MKTNNKTSRIFLSMLTAGVIFSAGTAAAKDYPVNIDADIQMRITQNMSLKINKLIQKNISTPSVFGTLQNNMMQMVSNAIKSKTAERKRASAVKTCMECRAGKPITVTISGKVDILDAATQAIINGKMAKMVEENIRLKSSDPAVVRTVQEKMMTERMQADFLRQKMQPFMTARILGLSVQTDIAGENSQTKSSDAVVSAGNDNLPSS